MVVVGNPQVMVLQVTRCHRGPRLLLEVVDVVEPRLTEQLPLKIMMVLAVVVDVDHRLLVRLPMLPRVKKRLKERPKERPPKEKQKEEIAATTAVAGAAGAVVVIAKTTTVRRRRKSKTKTAGSTSIIIWSASSTPK